MDPDRMDLDRLTPSERREALQAYMDGELPDADSHRVAAWLAVHPEARSWLDAHRSLHDLLGAYEDEPVPEGFSGRVLDAAGVTAAGLRAAAGPAPEVRALRLPRWLPVAAAALLLVGLALAAHVASRGIAGRPPAENATVALESVPADLLEHADLLLSLDDAEFDAVLALDPAEVADGSNGG
jgi:anti-sigma factor RsiW